MGGWGWPGYGYGYGYVPHRRPCCCCLFFALPLALLPLIAMVMTAARFM
jgi:hypothetical protein